MKLFLNTNVMIDLLCKREPHYDAAAKLMVIKEEGVIQIIVSSLSFVTCNYVMSRTFERNSVSELLKKFRILCDVANVDEINIDKSLFSKFTDFEDAVQYFAALKANADCIITRNSKDFVLSEIPIFTPQEFLSSINKK